MAIDKLALIRYKTIDDCLGQRYGKWTLAELIEIVSRRYYRYSEPNYSISNIPIKEQDIQQMKNAAYPEAS